MFRRCCFFAVCLLLAQTPSAFSKEWSDKSGAFQFEATLIAFDQENVVLQSTDKERMNGHELISIPRKDLSAADQEYLSSKDAAELTSQLPLATTHRHRFKRWPAIQVMSWDRLKGYLEGDD